MKTTEEQKKLVREKYGEIAESSGQDCCGPTSCCGDSNPEVTVFADDYSALKGYNKDADLNLGCGLPTQFAHIKSGHTVVDLGSGAGNDCFVARAETGESGEVIGVDFTEQMVEKARKNAEKLGYDNVRFLQGEIEQLPLDDETADVVVSNCVMNLVPDKQKAFNETYRILRSGGHFSISDIVLKGELPDALKNDAAMYVGCVAGAIQEEDYLDIIKQAGFENITIQKRQLIDLPDSVYLNYLSEEDWNQYKQSGTGIYSITVYGEKPEKK